MNTPHNAASENTPDTQSNKAPVSSSSNSPDKNNESQNHTHDKRAEPKPMKRNLSLITGSCILQHIETRFLNRNVRVKSFKGATINDLSTEISKMDLSRYQNIVVQVCGHGVDANRSQTSFREQYSNLLSSLKNENCKVYISGLLPRRGLNIKPYNDILR